MGPKKAPPAPKTVLMGRVGTQLKMGIVGFPNVGKSTFFNVLTKSSVPAENFPFCTIEPTEARVAVPDERFDHLVEKYKPASQVPAVLWVTDIAGLVKGAAEGEGLGNAFLANISACDGIFHMVRVFDSEDIIHVEGDVNPIRDIDMINHELIVKDLDKCETNLASIKVQLGRNAKLQHLQEASQCLEKVIELLKADKPVRCNKWSGKEMEYLNTLLLLTAKPMVYLLNLSPADYIRKKNKWLGKIKAHIDEISGDQILPFSAEMEGNLLDMETDDERAAWLKENNAQSALPRIIQTGYASMQLIYYFTSGADEVKAWTIQRGTLAPGAAGKIHGDFEKGFICAEVMGFADYKEHGDEAACKSAGKYKQQGKQYEVQDGDIILFKFNAGAGLGGKKK